MKGNIVSFGNVLGLECDEMCDLTTGDKHTWEGGWGFWKNPPFFTKWCFRQCDRCKRIDIIPNEPTKFVGEDMKVHTIEEIS